ncbi:MAG: Hsp70 family protein, partial [Akkermansia sp.]
INKADSMAHQIERQLNEMVDKVPADQKAPLEDKVKALKAAVEAKDVAKCKSLCDELDKLFAAAAQAAQAQGGAPFGGAAEAPQNNGPRQAKGKVVDAEVVDDDK